MDPSAVFIPSSLQNAAVLTIVLAFAGYLVTFLGTRMMAQRADKLRLVNARLNEFYGPLYVASQAGHIAYKSMLKKQGKELNIIVTEEELKDWILWLNTIFMPLNNIRERIIIEKAYLIVEQEMPQCLLEFVTHVVGYKAVLAKWSRGDYTERRSLIDFPPGFDEYVQRSYTALKAEQQHLMHSTLWSLYHRVADRKGR
jgi:hypothetical protein